MLDICSVFFVQCWSSLQGQMLNRVEVRSSVEVGSMSVSILAEKSWQKRIAAMEAQSAVGC